MGTIILKPVSQSDADIIFESSKGNVAEYFYNFKNIDEVRVWVSEALKSHTEGKKLEFMAFHEEEFIGMISPCYLTKERVEIGIWIAIDKQGKGYGAKVLNELLERLKSEGVKEVIYETESNNKPSIRLAKSLGFKATNEGVMIKFIKILA